MAPENSASNGNGVNGLPEPSIPAEQAIDTDLIDVLIDLQNKVVASGFSLDLNIPQIAVVGEQSSGKSSVLENIVGQEFLPRGIGCVTKRPILIHLYPEEREVYAVFGHKPDVKFTDFSEVQKELVKEMPETFTKVPVKIDIHSPRVMKLTLIDLPGVFCNSIDGQSDSSKDEVKKIVMEHISHPDCIILAVIAANVDLQNCAGLNIAKEVDPDRTRTIGVVTKVDIMDRGTNAVDILNNRKIFLKRGYVAVMNRSQQDIIDKRNVEYILAEEKRFFEDNPCYKDIAHRMGTPYLQRMLQKTLRSHIKKCLPKLRMDLAEKLCQYEEEIRTIELLLGEGSSGKQRYMITLVNNFVQDISAKIMGYSEDMDFETITAGAYINYLLNTEVPQKLALRLVPTDEEVTRIVIDLGGMNGSISLPSQAILATCKKLVKQYEYPIMQLVDYVSKVLEEAIEDSAELLAKYPSTKQEVVFRIRTVLNIEIKRTKERLRDHLKAEMQYINLEHPDLDFSVCQPSVPPPGINKVWQTTIDDESVTSTSASTTSGTTNNGPKRKTILGEKSSNLMKILLQNESMKKKVEFIIIVSIKYLEIVSKQVTDLTVKYIANFLVMKVLNFIKRELVQTLLENSNFKALTEDCDGEFDKKDELEAFCKTLRDALSAIENF